jgi:3-oxoacyl-[acyl-carrier protein] reductase
VLIGKGIRVDAVAPGVIATPFHDRTSDDAAMEAMRKTVPLGRVGTAEKCAGALSLSRFGSAKRLRGYSGQIFEVDGGQLAP